MRNSGDSPAAVIDRVAELLDEFQNRPRLTLSELSGRTGLPRSSVHRLLGQLADCGWIRRDGRAYVLGRAVFEWGALAQDRDGLHRAAHPVLTELHSATGLVAHLAVLDGNHIRYLDKIGCESIPLPSRVGGRMPAHRTALGKAILAHTRAYDGRAPYPVPDLDRDRLRSEIAHARERRIAQEREESVRGIACIAAPIGDRRTCVGALSLTGPVDRVDLVRLATPVRHAAGTIWSIFHRADRARRTG
ncbi:IclR family transcriptional regulator [Rhodococcus yananensis]|uniref:IclR family transcriptional regulator n=1 Tax=Rhodococcus yananensis TaxID=2879464 RepID=UPI001CF80A29|nr:IclR family transcriptional regulator [Rhodococcus yananensis]